MILCDKNVILFETNVLNAKYYKIATEIGLVGQPVVAMGIVDGGLIAWQLKSVNGAN